MEYGELLNLYYPFARNENFPIDVDSIFETYSDALEYAKGGSRDDNYTTTAYLGQIISVVEEDSSGNTTVQVYKIVVETPAVGEEKEIWGLSLIGEGSGGDGKVKDVKFNNVSFLNEGTGIANFVSENIQVENNNLRVVKIENEEITIE